MRGDRGESTGEGERIRTLALDPRVRTAERKAGLDGEARI